MKSNKKNKSKAQKTSRFMFDTGPDAFENDFTITASFDVLQWKKKRPLSGRREPNRSVSPRAEEEIQ